MFTNIKHTETEKIVIKQGQIQVLWGLKLMQFLGPPLRKYKITYTIWGLKMDIYFKREKK